MIALSIMTCALGTHRQIPNLKPPPPRAPFNARRIYRELLETLSNRPFRILFISAIFAAIAAGVNTSLSIYFARHFWELTTDQLGWLQIPYFISAAIALWVAPRIGAHWGKRNAAISTALITIVITPLPPIMRMLGWFPENGTAELFYVLMIYYSVDIALIIVSTILAASMMADVVEDSEVTTGRRSEGTFFAASSFAQKAVNGLGIVIAGQLLALINFPAQAKRGEVPLEKTIDLAIVYIGAVGLLYLIAVAILTRFQLDRNQHRKNLEILRARSTDAAPNH